MKKSALLVFGCVTCLLIGCGKMKQITDEQAKEIAKDIMAKQDDPQSFTEPNNYIYKRNTKEYSETYNRYGKSQTTSTTELIFMIDVEKLTSYTYMKYATNIGESEKHITTFYDTEIAKIYTLINENGYKHRGEHSDITLASAKSQFINDRDQYMSQYKWRDNLYPFTLNNFNDYVDDAKSSHEKFKDEKDQYYNYYLRSNDTKSLRVTVDEKEKEKQDFDDDYKGYASSNLNLNIKNNLLDSYTKTTKVEETWVVDSRFYNKAEDSENIAITYGNAKIDIPSINDYPLENN